MTILKLSDSGDYSLLDSGDGMKLERFKDVLVIRPDPQVIWQKRLTPSEWKKSDLIFEANSRGGKWIKVSETTKDWNVDILGYKFLLQRGNFKHLGIFPEQSVHFEWLEDKIKKGIKEKGKVSVLNLFAYTGAISICAASCGAEVCHVDASKSSVDIAFKNRDLNQLSEKPIRFIVEDVRKFIEKEIKRGNTYDIIIMDPPIYGRGLKDEVWNLDKDLPGLLLKIKKLLSKEPLAVLLNGYASNYSHLSYKQILADHLGDYGNVSSGEVFIEEGSDRKFLLPVGIFAKLDK